MPHLRRWPNRDPLQEQGGINLYAYVNGDPFGYVDPDGRRAFIVRPIILAPAGTPTYSSNSGVYHPPYYNTGGNDGWVDNPEAQVEYDYYKSVCKGPLPPSGDECQDYRKLSH